jgi:Zn finger protein HypA/HybF involved in hydrogenase expression
MLMIDIINVNDIVVRCTDCYYRGLLTDFEVRMQLGQYLCGHCGGSSLELILV